MKNFSPALTIIALVASMLPALAHPGGGSQDAQRAAGTKASTATHAQGAGPALHQRSVSAPVVHERTFTAPVVHERAVNAPVVHQRIETAPAIHQRAQNIPFGVHAQSIRSEHTGGVQSHALTVSRQNKFVRTRNAHELPFMIAHPQSTERMRSERLQTWRDRTPTVWTTQHENGRRDNDRWFRYAWPLQPVQRITYVSMPDYQYVPIYQVQPTIQYVSYWPQQPVYYTQLGNEQEYYSSTCYNGDGDNDDVNSCYDYAAPVPNYGFANFVSTPFYNSNVQGVVVATTGSTMLLLTPSLQPIFVNMYPAMQQGYVNGGLRPGSFVDAYGYYNGNTFVATAVN